MTIRFEPCPVHEPTSVEYERPCVYNDETGRWACAVCGAEGEFKPHSLWNINAVMEKAKENADFAARPTIFTIVTKCFDNEVE